MKCRGAVVLEPLRRWSLATGSQSPSMFHVSFGDKGNKTRLSGASSGMGGLAGSCFGLPVRKAGAFPDQAKPGESKLARLAFSGVGTPLERPAQEADAARVAFRAVFR